MHDSKARICVPVCVRHASDLAAAVDRAAEAGDLVELRFDCLEPGEINEALRQYANLRQQTTRPFVITFRPPSQGGFREIGENERVQFWHEVANVWRDSSEDLADVEAEFLIAADVGLDANGIICSHHDFARVPNDLSELYESMVSTSAAVLKIAVEADDATDCIPIIKLLERARGEGRELIAIAMGQAGVMTRILGPSRGSFLTYGSLDDESTTARGQLTARELRDVYRIDAINGQTEIMGIIGRPIGHSISPHIHNAAFAKSGLNAVFIPFEVHDVATFIQRMVRPSSREIDWKLKGFSVTAPHKSAVIGHLNWIDEAAKNIGAVNTIVIEDGELHGYNTDAAGFIAPLKDRIGSLENLKCAVIGTGGAARAVVWALRNQGASVVVFARDRDKAKFIADQFKVETADLAHAGFSGFDVVINATPLGTHGPLEVETPAQAEQLRGVRHAYDLVYNPLETRFIREARAADCLTIGGLEMLIGQAVKQFQLWTGREPDTGVMRRAAERVLK